MQRYDTIRIMRRDIMREMKRNRERDQSCNDDVIIRYRDKRHAHAMHVSAKLRERREQHNAK